MSLKLASGRTFISFHFREVFEKCIEYIGKFFVHYREKVNFLEKEVNVRQIILEDYFVAHFQESP